MKLPRFRAVVLAAGLGRRLRPLTDFVPKPLLPVAGMAVVAHTLRQLAEAGCEAAALNLHHLGGKIRQRFGGAFDGMPLAYSDEPQILGTLGALAKLRRFLAEADLAVVINGDSLCRWPLARLVRRHLESGAAATLLLSKRASTDEFNPVGVDRGGRVVAFGREEAYGEVTRRRVFAGAHLFAPALVGDLEVRPSELVPGLYVPMLRRAEVLAGLETARAWYDLGTPRRYLAAARAWSRRGRGGRRRAHGVWIAPGGHADPGARLQRTVVERGARVEGNAEVKGSLVLPGARVGAGCKVHGSIVGFEAELPPGTVVEHRVVTPERSDVAPREQDSVVGGLVYSPIG